MSEENSKNIESSKNLGEKNLNDELEQLKTENSILLQLKNLEDKPTYRLSLLQELRTTNQLLQNIGLGLNSTSKKISNQNKILAAKLGVKID